MAKDKRGSNQVKSDVEGTVKKQMKLKNLGLKNGGTKKVSAKERV